MKRHPDPTRPPLVKRPQTRRPGCWLAGIVGWLLLSGYVVPPTKVLERWAVADTRGPLQGPVVVSVRWAARTGQLYAAGAGRSALALDGEATQFDAGPGTASRTAAFWRAVDLFWARSSAELALSLELAGVDLGRGGYARSGGSVDGVAHTLGARGEGEQDLSQVWFSRDPLWPVRVLLPGAGEVSIGPPGPDGWPAWLLINDETLVEIVGAPSPAPTPPDWAQPVPGLGPGDAGPADWRRVFEHLLR
jgi:hypothetical protein